MTTRSGTVQFLHISEFGYICQKTPHRAEEIVTGAINSVHAGQMVSIESTAAGREGYFYDFCMKAKAMQVRGVPLSKLDFKLFFFPWYIDKRYTLDNKNIILTKEDKQYFDMLKNKHGIKLTTGQKNWYVKKKELNGEKMTSEFPSTLDEAFSVSLEGAYYNDEMRKVFQERRISHVPIDPAYPVDTYWDLGMNDFTVIIFTQSVGPQIRFVDLYYNQGQGLEHYVKKLREKEYRYGKHVFPHDIEVRDLSGSGFTRKHMLYELGMRDVYVAQKIGRSDGIDRVRALFSRFWFDEEKTKRLYESLQNYRKEWDSKMGVFKNSPRHDENSHFADAVRVLATHWREELYVSDRDREEYEQYTDQAFFADSPL